MIHLITRLPLPYQDVLCRSLASAYGPDFRAWFLDRSGPGYPFETSTSSGYRADYICEAGYGALGRAIARDRDAVVILGGWAPMAHRILAITALSGTPVFVWADHPHPRKRSTVLRLGRASMFWVLNRVATGLLACGSPTADYLQRHGIHGGKIWVFPYWVDVPEQWRPAPGADPASPRSRQARLRVVTIGRHVTVKRFDVAIDAVARVNRGRREPLAELIVVGDGEQRSRLESRVLDLEAWPYVRFTGWLEPNAVSTEIDEADVLTAPSSFEPYGVAVLEAMAAGRAVLASEGVIAARDRDDGTGAIRFHRIGDAGQLAAQIEELAGKPAALRQAGAAARATAEKWHPRRAADIIQDALSKTRAGRRIADRRFVEPWSAR
jgi:glycosyltransferase involved in cell wall biosynthesis